MFYDEGSFLDSDKVAPDVIFPWQYHGLISKSTEMSPELVLMVAVLEQAIIDYQGGARIYRDGGHETKENLSKRRQKCAEETECWFLDDDELGLFSFRTICAHLNIDPAAFREQLKNPANFKWTWRIGHNRSWGHQRKQRRISRA